MAVVRVSEYGMGKSVTFDVMEESEKLSAYLKAQLENNPALEDMNEDERVIIKIMHGGIGVVDMGDGRRTYHVSSYNAIGDIPSDLQATV
jgi:hypothetical protein